jgi:hypothetical protein
VIHVLPDFLWKLYFDGREKIISTTASAAATAVI